MVTSHETVFHAVADPTRRAILDRLMRGGQSVQQIADDFPVSRPAISKHLRVLLEAQLVTEKRDGRQNIYALNATPLRQVDTWLHPYRQFWAVNLASLKAHVERKGSVS